MSSHSSLPKNLPHSKSKTKAKMFTLGSSPKKAVSPSFNNLDAIENLTVSSKEKSFLENTLENYRDKEDDEIDIHEREFNKAIKKPYVVRNEQDLNISQNLFKTPALDRFNYQADKEKESFQKNFLANQYEKSEIASHSPLSVKEIRYQKEKIVPEISFETGKKFNVQQSNFMLSNKTNWKIYKGECLGEQQEGYGIIQFQNQDKFMGTFFKGKAHGHGTYISWKEKIKIMGIWINNEICIDTFIMEKV